MAVATIALAARYLPITNRVVLGVAALAPYLMLGAPQSLIVFALQSNWFLTAAAASVTIAAVAVQLPWYVRSASESGVGVRVMSANLRYGRADADAVVSLAKENTDILALQELTPEKARLLSTAGLEEAFPFQALRARDDAAGVGIWSRYPISTSDTDDDFWLGLVVAKVRIPGVTPEAAIVVTHIIGIEGNRVQFTHPLLARGVYADARPSRRRKMHRALAQIEALPEVKARHLALATTSKDAATLEALDAAAEAARARGAPAAAAELVDLAIGLGGDTPLRRIRSSRYHFHAGNYGHARALLEPGIRELQPGPLRATAVGLLAEMRMYHNSFAQAAEMLHRTLKDAESDRALLVQTLILLSFARINTGEYDRSLSDASQAVTLSDELELSALRSQACAMWVAVNFMCGQGVDMPRLQRALELEDRDADVPVPFGASTVNALVLAWTGRLDEARAQVSSVRNRCIERAEYGHLMFIDLHSTLIEVWRGNFTEAAQIAKDAMERAEQLGGDHALVIADAIGAVVAAYAGREQEARTHACAAIEKASRCGSPRLADQAIMSLGFLEVSLGNNADALTTLEPLVARFSTLPGTEIVTAAFLPDAIEAMIALGRLDDAEPMIKAMENGGRRLNRAWMLAIGARCRSMMLAAQGQLEAATRMAQQAMTAHQPLPMPFERARTQLLLGQLQRRQRQKEAATTTLTEALAAFEGMKSALWTDRTRDELARTRVYPTRALLLTPSEQRVAELAASGLTNRDIGAAVFISPKTVEADLMHVYRKLGIHTRAELGRVIGQQTERKPHFSSGGPNG